MEKNTKDEQKRQTVSISTTKRTAGGGDGGEIGGLVVLGGDLAIAGLVAAFTFFKSRRHVDKNLTISTNDSSQVSNINEGFPKNDDEGNAEEQRGSSDGTSKTLAAQIESNQLVSTQSLIMELRKPALKSMGRKKASTICNHEDILLADNELEKLSVALAASLPGDDNENLFASTENLDGIKDCNMDENCSGEEPKSSEHVLEKLGDETMGEAAVESNADQAIWPEMLPEDSMPELIDEANDVQTEEHNVHLLNNKEEPLITYIQRTTHSTTLKIWISLLMVVLLLLYLLLSLHKSLSSNVLNPDHRSFIDQ